MFQPFVLDLRIYNFFRVCIQSFVCVALVTHNVFDDQTRSKILKNIVIIPQGNIWPMKMTGENQFEIRNMLVLLWRMRSAVT